MFELIEATNQQLIFCTQINTQNLKQITLLENLMDHSSPTKGATASYNTSVPSASVPLIGHQKHHAQAKRTKKTEASVSMSPVPQAVRTAVVSAGLCLAAFEVQDDGGFFVIPTKNGKVVVIPD